MLFYKPKNLKYTTMAIYIDEHVYTDDCNDNLVFEYLYHLSYMLAHQGKFFQTFSDYDDFAIYCATNYFLRLKNKKQFIYDENQKPKMVKIKSILNFMKKTINFRRISYQQEYYSQIIFKDCINIDTGYTFANQLSEEVDALNRVEFVACLEDVSNIIKAFIAKIPHKQNSAEWDNIYISCLLSFLNQITLTKSEIIKVQKLINKNSKQSLNKLDLIYSNFSIDSIILFHLPNFMKNYIYILVNEIKHIISKDLSLSLHTYIPTCTSLGLSLSTINSEEYIDE